MTWNCPICTFRGNIDARTLCEVCGSEKPAQSTSSNSDLVELMALGFSEHHVQDALSLTSDKDEAINWLISNPDTHHKDSSLSNEQIVKDIQALGFEKHSILEAIEAVGKNKNSIMDWIMSNDLMQVDEKVQVIGGDIDDMEAEKLIQKAKREEAKRNKKQALLEKRRREEARMKIDIAKEEREIERVALEKQKAKERSERVQLLKEKEDKELDEMHQRKKERLLIEKEFETIPDCIRELRRRYGSRKATDVITFIARIVQNVISYPKDENFRCIRTDSLMFDKLIVQHTGGRRILELLGFRHLNVEENEKYVMEVFEPEILENELEKLTRLLNHPKTRLNEILEMKMESDGDQDALVFALLALHEIFDQICINPTPLTQSLYTSDNMFRQLLKPCPLSLHILKEFGFVRKTKKELFLESPDISLLEKAKDDLIREIANRLGETKIFLTLQKSKELNPRKSFNRVTHLLKEAFGNFFDDPHQSKFHRLNLKKLLGKQFKGGIDLIGALGLQVEKTQITDTQSMAFASFQYPKHSEQWYSICYQVFRQSLKNLT